MAGSAPPPDGPPPIPAATLPQLPIGINPGFAIQVGFKPPTLAVGGLGAGLSLGVPEIIVCGFKLPFFKFSLGFGFPGFAIPLPAFTLALGLNCASFDPLDVGTGSLPWGGGRVSNSDPDPDLTLDKATS